MPDRVVRDELLTSERYWRLSDGAARLFLSILLTTDDAARCDGSLFHLRVRCMAGHVSDERIANLLTELVDNSLVIPYEVGGKRYLHIPRFGQRRRYEKASRYPAPPNEIKDVYDKKSDSSRTKDVPKSNLSQTEVGPKTREVKRSEVKRNISNSGLVNGTVDAPNSPEIEKTKTALENKVETAKPNNSHDYNPWGASLSEFESKALKLAASAGIKAAPGETFEQLYRRAQSTLNAKTTAP